MMQCYVDKNVVLILKQCCGSGSASFGRIRNFFEADPRLQNWNLFNLFSVKSIVNKFTSTVNASMLTFQSIKTVSLIGYLKNK
jgi:hypothetical protein